MKTIHDNSVGAYHSLDIGSRENTILAVYQEQGKPLTDRQVGTILGFIDLNACKPRISELLEKRLLRECGKVRDQVTKKTVRLVEINKETDPQMRFA